MEYRKDIQILRGISVLLVVFFHFGFVQFSSGFLGVDIFFVISGFLMAVLYQPNNKLDFFKRRVVRLLPSYYLVILLTLLASFIVTSRHETAQVVEQAFFASIFSSNVGFWSKSDYFNNTDFMPLLHLWSLGVEIQFYILIPLIVWLLNKNKSLLIIITLVSLSLCLATLTLSPKTSFFLTPFRLWQFLIGFAIAQYLTDNGNVSTIRFPYSRLLSFIGLSVILLIPLYPVDGKSLTVVYGHPGVAALVVSLATSCVLAFGLPRVMERSRLGNILETLGKYSYSIYLVHFPVIVLYNSEPFEGTIYGVNSFESLVTVIALVSILSYGLYNFVERGKLTRVIKDNWKTFCTLGSLSVIFMSVTLSLAQSELLDEKDKRIFSAHLDRSFFRCGRMHRVINPGIEVCELTGNESDFRVLLAGNSHADSIKSVFTDVAERYQHQLYFFVRNDTLNVGGLQANSVVETARTFKVDYIFVHQYIGVTDPSIIQELVLAAKPFGIDIVYIEPVPVWSQSIPLFEYNRSQGRGAEILNKTLDDYYNENSDFFNGLDSITSSNFHRVAVAPIFCTPQCNYKSSDSRLYYFDSHHLTLTGSKLLESSIEQFIRSRISELDEASN